MAHRGHCRRRTRTHTHTPAVLQPHSRAPLGCRTLDPLPAPAPPAALHRHTYRLLLFLVLVPLSARHCLPSFLSLSQRGTVSPRSCPCLVPFFQREMLVAPQQHLMMHQFDTSPSHHLPSGALPHASSAGGRFAGTLPPLAPTAATLGSAASGGAGGAMAAGGGVAGSASGLSGLLTSALYPGHKRTGSGGSADFTLRGRRGSGASDYGPAYQGLTAMGHSALAEGGAGGVVGPLGSGGGGGPGGSGAESYCAEYEDVAGPSGGGVEVPLVAVTHHSHNSRLQSGGGSGGLSGGAGPGAGGGGGLEVAGRRGSAGGLVGLGGSGGGLGGGGGSGSVSGGSMWAKLKGGDRSGRGGRGGNGAGGGGNSSGDDAPYERLPMMPVSSKRAHGE